MSMTLEKNIRFSQSQLWRDQKKYYDEKGIEAWKEDVPFYITSNPFIGSAYAQLVINFMRDMESQSPEKKGESHVFYILELGSGTGQFSFYFLKNIVALQKTLQLEHIKFRYIMSDVTDRSFDFWEKHHALQEFLQLGILDFAVLDLYHVDQLKLHRSQEIISNLHYPLIIIANYIFDSIASDIFTVNDGKLYESLITVSMPDQSQQWKKAKIIYKETLIKDSYYHNEFDEILFDYQQKLIDTHFQFPIASLQALNHLKTFSNNQFLLVTSDKGSAALEELDYCEYPELDFHGSFSVMMNYHAVAEFVKKNQGEFFSQSFREHIITGLFSCGFSLSHLPLTQWNVKQMIQGFSPTDYFILYEGCVKHHKKYSLEEMSSYLNLSHWDPFLFAQIEDKLCDLAYEADSEVVSYLAEHMHLIAENFYYLPAADDTFFSIGVFFQNIGRFEEAMKYYQHSLTYFGHADVTLYNMGMCCQSLGRQEEATQYLKSAKQINGV